MKIFITGIAGFLGSHLADHFIREGHQVVGMDNMSGGEITNVPNTAKFILGDCKDLAKVKEAMEGCDIVYNCACTAYEGLSVFSPKYITDNTYGLSVTVMTAAIQNNVKRFIQLSSMARYGALETPFTEDMKCVPQDPYGIAKYASELTLRNLCQVHGMEFVIAVPHNIIGPRQKYDDPYRNVVSIMINKMLKEEQPIIYGDGEQKRCYSFVDDVVNPLALMATAPQVVGEVINIGPDDNFITVNQLAQLVADALDFDLKPIYHRDRPCEVKLANCSANKAKIMLGYKPTKLLEDGILDMIEYIKEKGVRPFNYHIPLEIDSKITPITWKAKLI